MTGKALWTITAVLAIAIVGGAGWATRANADENGKSSAFERFKQLAGDWTSKAEGEEMQVTYRVTSGGSAVVETDAPGTPHEMVTMIHPDGDSVILTHYCMLGNQPQMKAPGATEGNQVAFKFTKATNLKSDKAPYMHDVTYTFVDKNTLKAAWTMYQDGKPGAQMTFELKRK
jgi:hypothetical protein